MQPRSEFRIEIGTVTGIGSMMMVHLTDEPLSSPEDSGKVPAVLRGLIHMALLERGYYVARRNMIVLSLPMGDAEIDGLVAAFGETIDQYASILPKA